MPYYSISFKIKLSLILLYSNKAQMPLFHYYCTFTITKTSSYTVLYSVY